jgi:hypothetical protein
MVAALLVAAALAAEIVLPPDDPEFQHCIDPGDGVRLDWRQPDNGARTYLLVKRLDDNGAWRPWLRTERADPPFTLTLKSPLAHRSRFAWMLFEVENGRRSEGEWRYFCTESPAN